MRGIRLLRPFVRCAAVVVVVGVAASRAVPAAADGDVDPSLPYFSKRIGGPDTRLTCIAAGPDGSVLAAGTTQETDLSGTTAPPAILGADRFFVVTLLAPNGEARWTSYLRSYRDHSGFGHVAAVRAAADGSVWIAGDGRIEDPSDTEPERDDADAWIAKFDAAGGLVFATTFGGSGDESAKDLALTAGGDAIFVGDTASVDLPLVNPFEAAPSVSGASFVAGVRGDGSGIAWSSYVHVVNAAAVDGAGEVVVAGSVLTRISAAGALISSAELFTDESSVVSSLATLPDGRVVAGGSIRAAAVVQGFVVPVGPEPVAAPGFGWSEAGAYVLDVAAGPDGAVLVRAHRASRDGYDGGVAAFVLSPELRLATTITDRDDLWGVVAVAVASDGARCLVGTRLGVPFNPRVADLEAFFADRSFVARLPASGAAAPSRVRVVRSGERSVDLAWTGDGDPAAAFEVEAILHPNVVTDKAALVRRVSGRARSAHVEGLRPGEYHQFRLVAVFASGVRTAVPVPYVTTRPAAVRGLVAREYQDYYRRGRSILVRAKGDPNGRATSYQFQRKVIGGTFAPVRLGGIDASDVAGGNEFNLGFDFDHDVIGRGVAYRVRAVTKHPRRFSRWTYAFYVIPLHR